MATRLQVTGVLLRSLGDSLSLQLFSHDSTHHCNDESGRESVATRLDPDEAGVELHVTWVDGLDSHRHQLDYEHPTAVHVEGFPLALHSLPALLTADRVVDVGHEVRCLRRRAIDESFVDLDDAGLSESKSLGDLPRRLADVREQRRSEERRVGKAGGAGRGVRAANKRLAIAGVSGLLE